MRIINSFFGFSYVLEGKLTYFVWNVMPYGYTKAPYIAKHLIKPLLTHWRYMKMQVCVFFDDGMSVSKDKEFLLKSSLQIQCDLVRAGFIPGVQKCKWTPVKKLD